MTVPELVGVVPHWTHGVYPIDFGTQVESDNLADGAWRRMTAHYKRPGSFNVENKAHIGFHAKHALDLNARADGAQASLRRRICRESRRSMHHDRGQTEAWHKSFHFRNSPLRGILSRVSGEIKRGGQERKFTITGIP